MKTKEEIVKNWLPRYTKRKLEDFEEYILLTNFDKYVELFAKWFDVPVHEETGIATPMGIAFGPDGDLYICDNQGWSGKEELCFKGRILRVKTDGDNVVKCTVRLTSRARLPVRRSWCKPSRPSGRS